MWGQRGTRTDRGVEKSWPSKGAACLVSTYFTIGSLHALRSGQRLCDRWGVRHVHHYRPRHEGDRALSKLTRASTTEDSCSLWWRLMLQTPTVLKRPKWRLGLSVCNYMLSQNNLWRPSSQDHGQTHTQHNISPPPHGTYFHPLINVTCSHPPTHTHTHPPPFHTHTHTWRMVHSATAPVSKHDPRIMNETAEPTASQLSSPFSPYSLSESNFGLQILPMKQKSQQDIWSWNKNLKKKLKKKHTSTHTHTHTPHTTVVTIQKYPTLSHKCGIDIHVHNGMLHSECILTERIFRWGQAWVTVNTSQK